jgi:hypothetical protein
VKAVIVLADVVGAFFVVRAVAEIVVIDGGDSSSDARDWGGPTLAGVLAVHCLPGGVAAALMIWGAIRLRRRRPGPAGQRRRPPA